MAPERIRARLRVLCGALALLAAGATLARAAEHSLPGIDFPESFAAVEDAARFEVGGDDGLAWLRVTSDGGGRYTATRNRPSFEPLDFGGRFIKLRIRLDPPGGLAGMEFRLGSSEQDYFAFSVPRFSDPEFNGLQPGEWTVLTFSFGAARCVGHPRRSAIRWISWGIRDDGTRPLRAYWGGISAVDEPADGILSFTFDDGYDEHHQVAAPRMAEYGFRGTAYIMPDQIGDPGYMTEADLHGLHDEYGWDVAAHHAIPFTDFEPKRLERVVLGIQRFLIERGFQRGSLHLAYPLGKQDPRRVLPIVRHHFATARLADAGPETIPPGDSHRLRAMNVQSGTRPEAIRDAARAARDYHHWLILMFHFLVDEPARPTDYRISDFERALRLIHETGIAVRPVSEVWPIGRSSEAERAARIQSAD